MFKLVFLESQKKQGIDGSRFLKNPSTFQHITFSANRNRKKTRFFVPTYFLQTKETEKIELPNKSKQIQATTSCIVKTTFESPNITYVKSLFFWK